MNGIINLLKPPGISSFGALNQIKKKIYPNKIGHTGTLDPAAAGVLPLCLGKATKIADYLLEQDKAYWCEVVLGIETDTDDGEGTIISEKSVDITPREVEDALMAFIGVSQQIPPAYSAVKLKGVPAYKRARQGEVVSIAARPIEIYNIKIIKIDLPVVRFYLKCSKGTYIRGIARDLGRTLGCGGFLNFLIRTQSGPFVLEDTCTLEDIERNGVESFLKPIDFPLSHFPFIKLKDSAIIKVENGQSFFADVLEEVSNTHGESIYRLYGSSGKFLALCKFKNKVFKPFKVFI